MHCPTLCSLLHALIAEVDEPIVIVNDTPDVDVDEAANLASVRVDFTLRNDVDIALCSLGPSFPFRDCKIFTTTQLLNTLANLLEPPLIDYETFYYVPIVKHASLISSLTIC